MTRERPGPNPEEYNSPRNNDWLNSLTRPTDSIIINGETILVPPIHLESQGKIDNPLREFFETYMADGYDEKSVEALTAARDGYWGAFCDALPRFEGEGNVFVFGVGTGVDMKAILQKSDRAKVYGFDMAESGMRIAREKLASYSGRTAFLQADLAKPLINIPDNSARAVSSHAVDLFMSLEGKKNMYREAARVLLPEGKFYLNNLVNYPFNDILRAWVQHELPTNPEGVAKIMQNQKYATAFDEGRQNGSMHAATAEEQRELLFEAGFKEVEVMRELTHPALDKPFGIIVSASAA